MFESTPSPRAVRPARRNERTIVKRSQPVRTRLGAVASFLGVLIAGVLLFVAPTAAADTSDWRDRLAHAAAANPGLASPADVKESIAATLAPLASPPVTQALLDAVEADAGARYADGLRPASEADALATLGDDGTDRALAAGLQALLNATSAGDSADVRLDALADVLHADRRTVETVVSDAAFVASTAADTDSVRLAREQLALAAAAWGHGQPVSVVAHDWSAIEHAWAVLTRNGIAYTPGADRDGDGASDLVELHFGSSPLLADSDGDGLRDAFEISRGVPFHLPSKADTDGNAMGDGVEDVDGDGLDALREQALGSDPLRADSDGEGLADGREAALGTSPLKPDTDDDGLDDAAELRAGTDPLRADSDGDGILDGQDRLTATVTSGGVSIELTGRGDLSGALTVRSLAADQTYSSAPGQVGSAFDLDLGDNVAAGLGTAELTLPYPASFSGDANDLRLFTLDPDRHFWLPVAGAHAVDPAAHTVTATVSHFSIYAVFDIRNWNQRWTAIGGTCKPRGGGAGEPVHLDLVLTIDSSGSMTSNDPSGLRKTAAKSFVDALLAQDRSAVVDFDTDALLLQALTTNKTAVKAAIDRIDSSGGTNIGAGVQRALNELATVVDPARAKLIVLLTDGEGDYTHTLTERASREQVTIYTIGLGSSVDAALLRAIAERTGGTYYPVARASDLPEVFRELEHDTGDSGVDTDGDGLTDCQETEGMQDFGGLVFTSDPRLVDTDGDGLEDGDEVGRGYQLSELPIIGGVFPPGTLYYDVFSDPHAVDTESDGLTDLEDLAAGARARSNETDGDGLGDLDEVRYGTDPSLVDTDEDGQTDGFEVANRSHGFDPLDYDDTYSGFDYARDFTQGFFCFELFIGLCDKDSIPWLLGNVAHGFFVVTDLFDALGNLLHGELYSAGISLLAVVPLGGDALKFVDKAIDLAKRGGRVGRIVIKLVMEADHVPTGAKLRLIDAVYGESATLLRAEGVADDALIRLAKGRMDLHLIADATRGAAQRFKSPEWFTPKDAEAYLRGFTSGNLPTGHALHLDPNAVGTAGARIADAFNLDTLVALEAKAGYQDGSRVLGEIAHDAALKNAGVVSRVEWHFFPSDAGKLGPSRRVLEALETAKIPYYVHLP